jgi:quercetin dioxygenase-like cupin family protein
MVPTRAALANPLPIDQVEAIEAEIKAAWAPHADGTASAATRREFAQYFHELGFLAKYKSYGVKYSSPFGYSLFDLVDNGGFSIQVHETAKVEAFHILGLQPTAFVVHASLDEWAAHGLDMVAAWDRGDPTASPLAYRPEPGDLVVISDLHTVHTVVGCVLEEYATTSYDIVMRLHDQNTGDEVRLPPQHRRVGDILAAAPPHAPRRRVHRDPDWRFEALDGVCIDEVDLPDAGLRAGHLVLEPGATHDRSTPTGLIDTFIVLAGEVDADVDGLAITLAVGDLVSLLPGSRVSLSNHGRSAALLSACSVSRDLAFADLRDLEV